MNKNLWHDTASLEPATFPLPESRRADVLIVGAGYTGLSSALHLAQKGAEVAVVEAEEIGFGGSGRNMGQVNAGFLLLPEEVIRHLGPELGARMNTTFAESAELVFSLIKRYAIECDAVREGNLFLAHDRRSRALITKFHDQHLEQGASVQWLEHDAVQSLVGSPVYTNGVLDQRSGNVQPLSYARGLARAALEAGADIYTKSRVIGLTKHHDGWEAKTSHGASITAPSLVLATDSYSDSLWPGLKQTLIPVTAQQIATEPLGQNVSRTILDGGQASADRMRFVHYFKKDRDGRLLLVSGGSSAPGIGLIKRFFPQLEDIRLAYQWNGIVAMSRDHLPYLCRLAPGLTGVVGFSGRGLSAGTMVGKILSRYLSGELAENELPIPVRNLQPQSFWTLKRGAINIALTGARWLDGVLSRRPHL